MSLFAYSNPISYLLFYFCVFIYCKDIEIWTWRYGRFLNGNVHWLAQCSVLQQYLCSVGLISAHGSPVQLFISNPLPASSTNKQTNKQIPSLWYVALIHKWANQDWWCTGQEKHTYTDRERERFVYVVYLYDSQPSPNRTSAACLLAPL